MAAIFTVLAIIAVLFVLGCMFWQSTQCVFTYIMLNTSGAFSAVFALLGELVGELTKDN